MRQRLKELAVEKVKPRVSEQTWRFLRQPNAQTWKARSQPKSLTELAKEFETDKWGLHRYTPHYEHHLQHLRDQRFTMLEIGIGGYAKSKAGGASLRMWKAFFPKAQIVGLDIEDKSFVDQSRIRTYQGSQVDPVILDKILTDAGDVQVIIDDGSHRPEHIRETFAYLFPRLAPNGIYAIEDINTSYWPVWGGSTVLTDPTTSVALVKDLLDGLHYEEFAFLDPGYKPTYTDLHVIGVHVYHNLVIIEKGSNREGTNSARNRRTFPPGDPQYTETPPIAEQRRPWSFPGA